MAEKNLALALALSAGLHLIVMLTLNVAPGSWRHGFQPALRAVLRDAPGEPGPVADAAAAAISQEAAAPPAKEDPPRSSGQAARPAQEGGSLPLSDRYFRASEVDEPAVPVERGPLVFPEDAYIWKLAGSVRARVFISEKGGVDSVRIVEARPRRGIFEAAALEALRQVKYEPARIGGVPVKSQKLIEVSFNPYEESPTAPR